MSEAPPRRELVTTTPMDGHHYARLALGPHRNLVHLIGDPARGAAAVIDPAWDVPRIHEVAARWGCRITAALFTHNHGDHIEGAPALAEAGVPLYAHAADAPALERRGISVRHLADGDTVQVGDLAIVAHHTPGHTAGGITYQCGRRLFTGDLLFIGQAGRTDFPSGSKEAMWDSLQRIKRFPDDHILCPGHDYGAVPEATLGDERMRSSALLHTDFAAFAKEWYLVAY